MASLGFFPPWFVCFLLLFSLKLCRTCFFCFEALWSIRIFFNLKVCGALLWFLLSVFSLRVFTLSALVSDSLSYPGLLDFVFRVLCVPVYLLIVQSDSPVMCSAYALHSLACSQFHTYSVVRSF